MYYIIHGQTYLCTNFTVILIRRSKRLRYLARSLCLSDHGERQWLTRNVSVVAVFGCRIHAAQQLLRTDKTAYCTTALVQNCDLRALEIF